MWLFFGLSIFYGIFSLMMLVSEWNQRKESKGTKKEEGGPKGDEHFVRQFSSDEHE